MGELVRGGISADSKIEIHLAETEEEKRSIYRLRYQVYIEEMGRELLAVDHENRFIKDDLDEWSILLYAQCDHQIVGTIRLSLGSIDTFPNELSDAFEMERFVKYWDDRKDSKFGFGSKFIVDPRFRGSHVVHGLLGKFYEKLRQFGAEFCYCGCNLHMIPLYEQLGFRRFARNFLVPDYNYMVPFVMMVEDIEHLRKVRSPFYRVARKEINSANSITWFKSEFPEAQRFINSQLTSQGEMYQIISRKLGQAPERAIRMLMNLSQSEVSEYLHNGVIVPCHKGDRIIEIGDVANEHYILLSGELKEENSYGRVLIRAGQSFGEVGLVAAVMQMVAVTAVDDSELLVISRQAFERFQSRRPGAANKILRGVFESPGRFRFSCSKVG